MKNKLNHIATWFSKKVFSYTWLFLLLLLICAFIIRIWHIGAIREPIFDEIYFVKFAQNYLGGVSFFDIHPPLGKLIIAVALKIIPDSFTAGRIMQSIFGTGVILLGYLIGKQLKNKLAGLFTAIILALDGAILVYSRMGLMDIFMLFFILLGFYAFLKYSEKLNIYFLVLSGVSLGLATSVKYIAGVLFLAYVSIMIVKKLPFIREMWKYLIFLIALPTIIYLSIFLFNFPLNKEFLNKVIEWHWQSLHYNFTLKDSHPYGSKWWSWFLLLRPIWFYFKDVNHKIYGIVCLGNPLAWWSSLVVIPVLIWRSMKKERNAIILLAAFLLFLLPWAFFKRVLFYYHAIPSFGFLAIATGYLLEGLTKDKFGRVIIWVYFGLLLFLFIYFLPIWIGSPISSHQFYEKMWLKSWI